VVGELLGHPGRLHSIIVSSTVTAATLIALEEEAAKTRRESDRRAGYQAGGKGVRAASLRCWSEAKPRQSIDAGRSFESFGKNIFHVVASGSRKRGQVGQQHC